MNLSAVLPQAAKLAAGRAHRAVPGHRWLGGEDRTTRGGTCNPNIPTEEVFTTPHAQRTDGVVRSTKPLAHQGGILDQKHRLHAASVPAAPGQAYRRRLNLKVGGFLSCACGQRAPQAVELARLVEKAARPE